MGLDNPIHIAFLVVILMLVFGAKRLPEMGRSIGTGLRGFRETISGEHTEPTAALTAANVPAESHAPVAATASIPAESHAPVAATADERVRAAA